MKTTNFISKRTVLSIFLSITMSIAFVSCDSDDADSTMTASTTSSSESIDDISKRAPKKGDNSIAAIAVKGGFNELVKALVYVDQELNTGLVNMFANGKDQYTVFAPTDEAFQNLYEALGVTEINQLEPELVLNVLKYHVVEGRRAANSVVPPTNSKTITTLLGATFMVDKMGVITAVGNSANIKSPNNSASNGIIHVVDAVLLPIKIN